MYAHRKHYPVIRMSQVLGVSRSGYYAWIKRGPSCREQENMRLLEKIEHIHQESRETYGSPRIHAEMRAQGETCNHKRVARLMRLNGLQAKRKRRRGRTTDSRHGFPAVPNWVKRPFQAQHPNQIWLADITYIHTQEGWLYLAGVLDLFSRKVVGWAMDRYPTSQLCQTAFQMALERRHPQKGGIHHSDRGVQYASHDFQALLKDHDFLPSMSAKGNCYDNAPMESFYATLKTELVHHCNFSTRSSARNAIFEYIEVFYNRQRRHSALDYLSPENYERRYYALLNSLSTNSG